MTEPSSPKELPTAPKAPLSRTRWIWLGLGLALLAVQYLLYVDASGSAATYSELRQWIDDSQVKSLYVQDDAIVVQLRSDPEDAKRHRVRRLPRVEDGPMIEAARAQGAEIEGAPESDFPTWMWLLLLAPLVLMFVVTRRMSAGMGMGGPGGPLSFGRSKAKLVDARSVNKVRFSDVAGVDEAKQELNEVVDFLRHPEKYRALGARIPKGVLLVGPPGTGKTLMARAVAGESQVPFFILSGSDFVEMFVGVGAARVRDLFAQAKQRSPCIIFIDELDAIGKSRGGAGAMATHDEREQTLNQLLAEMDGFDPSQGVILIAATNRPEVLDPALLRAGRFDRQVVLDRPDVKGRAHILGIHARRVPLADDVDLHLVAQRTPGMSGADLANVINEAALAAARRGAATVSPDDLEEAIDRMQLGLKKQGHVMREEEKLRVAFHEAGHALVALSLDRSDPVHRVTIIPRTIGALGATLQLPTGDRYLITMAALHDKLAVLMGGRVAEKIACGDLSTGAQNDLEKATEMARHMVCHFGMSEPLGPRNYGQARGGMYLKGPMGMPDERDYSEATAHVIDREIGGVLKRAEERAREAVTQRRSLLDAIVDKLLVDETLEHAQLEALVEAASATEGADPDA